MSSSAGATPTFPPVTRGESLNVLSWVLLCVTILALVSRGGTKYAVIRKFEWDDLAAFLALVFSAGLTIAISLQTEHGLGDHFENLSLRDRIDWQKASYASNILFVLTMAMGKSATVWQMQQINPFTWRFYISLWTNALIAIWAVTAVVASSLQCPTPRWQFAERSSCVDRFALFTYIDVSNLVTEAMVLFLPIIVLGDVKVSLQRKVAILSCFTLRLGVIITIIAQLANSKSHIYNSLDPTFDTWKRTMCLQVAQNLCVISCSIPYLKPFYMGIQSGLIRSDDMRRTGLTAAEYTQMSRDGQVSSKSDNGIVISSPKRMSYSAHGSSPKRNSYSPQGGSPKRGSYSPNTNRI